MVGARIYGALSSIVSTTTIGAVAASKLDYKGPDLTDIPYVGQVPIFAVGVGILTAFLVRWVTLSKNKSTLRSYNLAVTLLAMLGAGTFIIDHQIRGPGMAFWIGGTFGATGVSLIGIMRSRLFTSIIAGLKGGILGGMSEPPAASTVTIDQRPPAPPARTLAPPSE